MIDEHTVLSRLVGCWEGTLLHRGAADQPLQELPGTSENRWVLGGRFVEMTLRAGAAGDSWSAVFYIGYERSERRHLLVSLEPGERRVTTRRGEWFPERDRLVLTSERSRAVCDMTKPGELKLELSEESPAGQDFVRFRADYRPATAAGPVAPPARQLRRSVIA
jgi:hypothetical protein